MPWFSALHENVSITQPSVAVRLRYRGMDMSSSFLPKNMKIKKKKLSIYLLFCTDVKLYEKKTG
jgi:hypothetical protein